MPIWSWIYHPYPLEHSAREKWNSIIWISISLGLFLILLQPFGFIAQQRWHLFFAYVIIGLVTLTVNYFGLPYLLPRIFDEKKWTVMKATLFLSYNFVLIGMWNHAFNTLIFKNSLPLLVDPLELVMTVFKTTLLGTAASGFYILIRYNLLTRRYLEIAQELNNQVSSQGTSAKDKEYEYILALTLEGKKISINREDLIYLKAEGNYLAFRLKSNSNGVSQLYRGKMKDAEVQLRSYPEFIRCHRSYLVNLRFISKLNGNSKGLIISLNHIDHNIPVSRTMIDNLKERFDQFKH